MKIVQFESGKYGVRRVGFWFPFMSDYEFLDNAGAGDSLEFYWWGAPHSESIRKLCEFPSREAAQKKLDRYVDHINRPSSAVNDMGRPIADR